MDNVLATHRRSIRLKDWDYSRAGMYFVTICTQHRACLFGDVIDGGMRLNDVAVMIEKCWLKLNHKFPTVQTDQFVVMPNHIHGIITLVGADLRVCPPVLRVCPDDDQSNTGKHMGLPQQTHETGVYTDEGAYTDEGVSTDEGTHVGVPLPRVVQWFKTMTTNEYIRGVKQFGWPRFDGRFWQRNYHERIIRGDNELNLVREYIMNNPLKWELDRENPNAKSAVPAPEVQWLV
jgi:REP element-mobilizing transposase RayT